MANCIIARRVGFEKCPIPCKELKVSYLAYIFCSCFIRLEPSLSNVIASSAAMTAADIPSLSKTCVPHMKPER